VIEGYVYLMLSVLLLMVGWVTFFYNFWLGQIFLFISAVCFVAYMIKYKIKEDDKWDL